MPSINRFGHFFSLTRPSSKTEIVLSSIQYIHKCNGQRNCCPTFLMLNVKKNAQLTAIPLTNECHRCQPRVIHFATLGFSNTFTQAKLGGQCNFFYNKVSATRFYLKILLIGINILYKYIEKKRIHYFANHRPKTYQFTKKKYIIFTFTASEYFIPAPPKMEFSSIFQ